MTFVQVLGLMLLVALVPVGGALLFAATVRIALGDDGVPEAMKRIGKRGA
jgi:hypothetical protein